MGLAASQGRLLSLTGRLSDLEFQGQQINQQKVNLSMSSEELTQTYLAALNKTKLVGLTGFNNGAAVYQDLTYDLLTGPNSPLGGQYCVTDSSNRIIVPQATKTAFEGKTLDQFLASFGETASVAAKPAVPASADYKPATPPSADYKPASADYKPAVPASANYRPATPPSADYRPASADYKPAVPPSADYKPAIPPSADYKPATLASADYKPSQPAIFPSGITSQEAYNTKLNQLTSELNTANLNLANTPIQITSSTKVTSQMVLDAHSEVFTAERHLDRLNNDVFSIRETGDTSTVNIMAYAVRDAERNLRQKKENHENLSNLLKVGGSITSIVDNPNYEPAKTAVNTAEINLSNFVAAYKPAVPQVGTPGSPQVGTPGSPQVGTPGSPQVGTPQVGTPGTPQIGTPGSPQVGTPQVGTPGTPQVGTPGSPATQAVAETPNVGYYTNIYNRMLEGYTVMEDDASTINNKDWFNSQIKNGNLFLEKFGPDGKAIDASFNMNSEISSVRDTEDLDIITAEYEAQLASIQRKDKIFDMTLKQVDTEHNAIQTEVDSVKKVIQKNIESSFKTFG